MGALPAQAQGAVNANHHSRRGQAMPADAPQAAPNGNALCLRNHPDIFGWFVKA
jgi:hypothetical protein